VSSIFLFEKHITHIRYLEVASHPIGKGDGWRAAAGCFAPIWFSRGSIGIGARLELGYYDM
jgi:hypothetical protein